MRENETKKKEKKSKIMAISSGLLAAGITGATSLLGTGATMKLNKKSRRFQEKMFHKTNKYNSPIQQRKRLEKAGLNPNLVYGGSSGGTAGTASQPSKPDFNTPDIAGAGARSVESYFNTKAVQAGIDVNEARADNIRQETVNKGIDAVNKSINAAAGSLDYKTKKKLFDNTIKTAEMRLRNLGISGDYTSNKDRREQAIADKTVNKIQSEISNLKKKGKILSQDEIIKRLDAELYKEHQVRPQDPFYYSIMRRMLKELDQSTFNFMTPYPKNFKK